MHVTLFLLSGDVFLCDSQIRKYYKYINEVITGKTE